MLEEFLNYPFKIKRENLTWEHLGECDFHFDFFKILLYSFIEAVQRREFGRRFSRRMNELKDKHIDELLGVMDEFFKEAKRHGYAKEIIPFSNEQMRMLVRYFSEWGLNKTKKFFMQYIIPKLKENTDRKFTDT